MEALSVTIITRNEERNIERCLNAVRGIADEIVVVDSYSTDRTVEICHRYGCRVTSRNFAGFGPQRQYAVSLTSHNYVLSLDADEVPDEEMLAALRSLKAEGFGHRVYAARVVNYFCGRPIRHCGYEPQRHIRLFNKRYAAWTSRGEGDSVTCPDGVQPADLPGSVHHYRVSTVEEFHRKENRIASLRAGELARSGARILPGTPLLRASWQYIKCHIGQRAWLDGSRGNLIAMRRFKTTLEAYRMARHLIPEQR
ncbi:MAG: glycosyltransferase family 2 protein [Bacteroides sp.]|nr:glycosyltransferase family 2 protein [Bacteroides sp.]